MSEKKELSSTSNESKNNSSLDYGSLGNTTLPVFDDFDDPKQNLFSGAEFTYEPSHFIETIGFGKSQIIFILITSLGFISEYGLIQLMPLLSTHLYVSMGLTEEMESALGVASYSGFAVGYPLWGFISDKIGRKSATLLSALWVLLWSLLSCVAPDVYWLIVTRILFSFGAGAVNLIIPFLYEYLSRDYQWMGVLLSNQVGNALGCQMAILLAYFIFTADAVSYAWRYYMFIMIIPLILFVVLVYFFLDESPRYLMSKGKQDKALEILTKMAERNNILMPKQIKLIPDNELAHSDDPKLSLCEKLEIVCKNWDILRCVICLTLMGIASRFIFYGMSFVKTELVYMNGENNSSDYCDGTGSKTYYLDRSDYLLLLFFQVIADFFGAVGVAVVYKMNFAVKPTIMICFTVCIAINACLYLCPVIWAAVLLVSIVYILGCIVSTITWLKLSGLLPTNVRISMFGLCTFMMYFPIPFTPYLIQVFSKESQHLVTTTSLVFISVGFVGSIFLPRQIYAN